MCVHIRTHTRMNAYQPFAAASQLPVALRRLPKNDTPACFDTSLVNVVGLHCFEGPCCFSQKVEYLVK